MSAVFWIVIGMVVLAACSGSGKGKNRKTADSGGKAVRIDHMHYSDADDYECSVCGARFRKKGLVCPGCGARFSGTKDDDMEFIEEMEIWDDDDD